MEFAFLVAVVAVVAGLLLFTEWWHRRKRELAAQFGLMRYAITALLSVSEYRTGLTNGLKEMLRRAALEKWDNATELREAFVPMQRALEIAEGQFGPAMARQVQEERARSDLLMATAILMFAMHPRKQELLDGLKDACAHLDKANNDPQYSEALAKAMRRLVVVAEAADVRR